MASSVEERARGNVAVAGPFGDYRPTATVFTNVPQRSVVHTKLYSGTSIRVTYMDTIGWLATSAGQGCLWQLAVNGAVSGTKQHWSYTSNGIGWRIYPMKLVWCVPRFAEIDTSRRLVCLVVFISCNDSFFPP